MLVMLTALLISVGVNLYLMKRGKKTSHERASSVLLQGIQHVSELATIKQSFQSIVMYEDRRTLLGMSLPGTVKKFILKYSGNVIVGTDLSRAEVQQFASGRVTIAVPKSKIIEVHADMESVKVYDQREGIFASLEFDEQNRAIAENLKEIRQEADAGSLKKTSDANAKSLLEGLSRSMGIFGVKVEFFDADQKYEEEKPIEEISIDGILMPDGEKILVLS